MRWFAWFVLVLVGGCLQAEIVTCEDGRVCPTGWRCEETAHLCIPPTCGNGTLEDFEECDGALIRGACRDGGYYDGELGCSTTCTLDFAGCGGRCGDFEVQSQELCDGAPERGQTCSDFGFDFGRVSCSDACTPAFESCQRVGWRRLAVDPVGGLAALFVDDEVGVAVGAAGAAVVRDGVRWRLSNTGTTRTLFGVWGSAANDLFAVGEAGTIVHFDGTSWTAMASGTQLALRAISGTASNDVYAVGDKQTVLHFDGTTWSPVALGVALENSPDLLAVHATPTTILVTGDSPNRVTTKPPTILRRVGTGPWQAMTPPSLANGTWPERAYAARLVGDQIIVAGSGGFVYRFDGASWSVPRDPTTLAELQRPELYPDYRAMWATSDRDVYLAGENGFLLHFDLELAARPADAFTSFNTSTAETVRALAGAPSNLFAVTLGGDILHYDGFVRSTPGLGNFDVRAIATDRGTTNRRQPIAVTSSGRIARFRPDRGWSLFDDSALANGVIREAFMMGSTIVVTTSVGVFISSDDGTTFQRVVGSYYSVDGIAPTDFFVGTELGVIQRARGGTFEIARFSDSPPIPLPVVAIRVVAADSIYALHANRLLHSTDGTTWTVTPIPTTTTLRDLWVANPNEMVVVGDVGTILRFDGTVWHSEHSGTLQSLQRVVGTNLGELFAFSEDVLLRRDERGWTDARVDFPPLAMAVDNTPTRRSYLVGGPLGETQVMHRQIAPSERACNDTWDNDEDGATNCADSDCVDSPACSLGGSCRRAGSLACNSDLAGSVFTGIAAHDQLACMTTVLDGPESTYTFVPETSGQVTVELVEPSAEGLAIVVAPAFASGCDLASCTAASGSESRRVTFDASAGTTYDIYIDSPGAIRGAAAGAFTLRTTCP